jgi:hypothetical protein
VQNGDRACIDEHSCQRDLADVDHGHTLSSAGSYQQGSPSIKDSIVRLASSDVDNETCTVLVVDGDDVDVGVASVAPVHVILDSDNDDCVSVDDQNLSDSGSSDSELECVTTSPASSQQHLSKLHRHPRCISLSSDDDICVDDASDVEPIDLSAAHCDRFGDAHEEAEHSQLLASDDFRCDVVLDHPKTAQCPEFTAQFSGSLSCFPDADECCSHDSRSENFTSSCCSSDVQNRVTLADIASRIGNQVDDQNDRNATEQLLDCIEESVRQPSLCATPAPINAIHESNNTEKDLCTGHSSVQPEDTKCSNEKLADCEAVLEPVREDKV